MNNSLQVHIQCPFFVYERKKLLCCEGYINNTCMTTGFPDEKAQEEYIREHCFHMDGANCPMAKNLFEKYKRIEEAEALKRYKRAKEMISKYSSVR